MDQYQQNKQQQNKGMSEDTSMSGTSDDRNRNQGRDTTGTDTNMDREKMSDTSRMGSNK